MILIGRCLFLDIEHGICIIALTMMIIWQSKIPSIWMQIGGAAMEMGLIDFGIAPIRGGLFKEFCGTHSERLKERINSNPDWESITVRKKSHANMPLAVEFLSGISISLLSHVIDMPSTAMYRSFLFFCYLLLLDSKRENIAMMSVWNGFFKICHIITSVSIPKWPSTIRWSCSCV